MTTTYQYGSGSDAILYTVDYTGEDMVILEKNPFLISNKVVASYSDGTNTYYPLQLVSASDIDGKTLTATLADTGRVRLRNVVVESPFSTINEYVDYYVKIDNNYVLVTNGNKNTLGIITNETIAYTAETDISDIVLNAVLTKGKNQPFSYVVLTVSKQLFLDEDITLVQKSTTFTLNMYGMNGTWVFERSEDNTSTYDITLVSPAYYLKTITLLSLFNFTTNGTTVNITNTNLTSNNIVWNSNQTDGSFTITFNTNRTLTIGIKKVNIGTGGNPNYQYSLTKFINIKAEDLFAYLAHYVAGYDFTSGLDIQPGYYYSSPEIGLPTNIRDKYTMGEIERIVTKNTITSSDTIYTNVTIRLDEFAWDILQSLALLSNREIIFDDKAYFKPLDRSPSGNISINWEQPLHPELDTFYPDVMALAENDDQGSQYVLASQKVISEAYETTVAISDTTSTYVGSDIKFAGADDTQLNTDNTNNSSRNKQAKIIALNSLVKNYKPGDCIVYSVNETAYPETNTIITDWSQLDSVTGDAFIYQTTLPNTDIIATKTYFVKKNNCWLAYDTDDPIRQAQYEVTSCVSSIIDEHNNIELNDVPVALIMLEYPACVTTYTWGRPEFMDEQSQFNDLSAVSQDSVLDNTSDTGISSSDATKIVVGNQYVHQLQDDRAGFTGLIMEKNTDNNVYRLVGYNNGVVQAQFNSEGKIEAGAGVAQLDENGLTVYYDSNDTAYSPQNALKFQKSDETDTDIDGNPLTPYRLYAKYDSSSSSTTSVVQAQKQTLFHVYSGYTGFTSKSQYTGYYVDYNNTKVLVSNWSQSPYYFNTVVSTPGVTVAYTASEYPAILEMVCDQGGATTSMELLNNQTAAYIPVSGYIDINFPTGSTPHVVYISPTSDNTITGSVSINLVMSDNSIYDHIDTPSPGQTVAIGYYPQYMRSIRFRNNTGSQVYLQMSKWVVRYSNSSGTGSSLTLGNAGSELKGDLKTNGNMVQLGGSVVFYGPDGHTTGAISALTPTQFYTPILSNSAVTAPLIQGLSSVTVGTTLPSTGILKVGMNSSSESITALGKVDTRYATLNDFACRRIYISRGGGWSGTPQVGDILFTIS